MRKLLLAFFLLPFAAAAAEESSGFHVLVKPDVYSPKEFEGKGAQVGALPKAGNHPGALPSREKREAVFQKVPGLSAAVAKFDELERDLLYMRAGSKSLKDLKKAYPQLGAKVLSQLKKERALH